MKPSRTAQTVLLILVSLTYTGVFAQWTGQTSPTTKDLQAVFFTDVNTGWSVGKSGTIIKTTNGGVTWSAQTSGVTNNLAGVFFISSTTGWVVGASATILKTTNGGTAWTAQTVPISNNINNIYFVSTATGWAVANTGKIITTSDGGTTWTAQTSGITQNLMDVYFVSATTGWAVGSGGKIVKTTNGGTTWTAETSGTTKELDGVSFIDANTGWAAGANGTIIKTTNGGTTWTAETSGNTTDLNDIQFASSTTGWAVGQNGEILTTTNGGATWTAQTSASTKNINGMFLFKSGGSVVNWAVTTSGNIQTMAVVTLPVTLTSFEASTPGCGIGRLEWHTASEHNNIGFTIQWSTDGSHWQSVGTVAGSGNSSTGQSYTFTDDELSAGANFFRLEQMDEDGGIVYSPIVLLNNACAVAEKTAVYPNPTRGQVTVQSNDTRLLGTRMTLVNMQGQAVQQVTITRSQQGIDLSALPASIYILVMADGQSYKIMKQ